jgi:hypothetical protein
MRSNFLRDVGFNEAELGKPARPRRSLHCSPQSHKNTMPRIRTTRTKKPPEGFEDVESVCV